MGRRNRGEGGIEKIGRIYYYTFWDLRGRHIRKSSKSPLKSVAIEELRKAKEKLAKGIAPESGKALKYEDIRALLIADYTDKGKVEMVDGEMMISGRGGRLKALDDYFIGMPVRHITTDVIREFKAKRKAEGVCGPSVNRNLAALRRMFNMARRENKLSVVPYFPMDAESRPDKLFLPPKRFDKLRRAMPKNLHPLLLFLYTTGCRFGAATQILWAWVNLRQGVVEIPTGVVKNDDPITLPVCSELRKMLKKVPVEKRQGPVFDATNWKREWYKACVACGEREQYGEEWWQSRGLKTRHFRQSAAVNMSEAGVAQHDAMEVTGHKTDSMWRRYDIVDTKRKKKAMAKVEALTAKKG
jgi:integrase